MRAAISGNQWQSACNQRAHLISQHVMRQHEARHHLLMWIARWKRDVQAYLWGEGGRRRSEHLHAGRLPVGSDTCKRTSSGGKLTSSSPPPPLPPPPPAPPSSLTLNATRTAVVLADPLVVAASVAFTCGERGSGAVVSTCMPADSAHGDRRRLGGVHLECGEMSGELCRIGAFALIVL
jgi:hypothetical protein